MFKRVFGSMIAVSALVLTMAPATLAAPSPIPPGAPAIDKDRPTGYYIWRTDDGWHLRTHGPGAEHDFVATLRTNGTFVDVDSVKLEKDDRVEVVNDGHVLKIHFHTFDFTDGVNFRIKDGERLRFRLKLDGKRISTNSIFLGQEGRHPKRNPFSVEL